MEPSSVRLKLRSTLFVLVLSLLLPLAQVARADSDFYVALASFESTDNAEIALSRAESSLIAFPSLIPVEVDGRFLYRLVIGPYSTRSEAEQERQSVVGYEGAWIWSTDASTVLLGTSDQATIQDAAQDSREDASTSEVTLVDTAPKGYSLNKLRVAKANSRNKKSARHFQTDIDIRGKLFSTTSLLPANDIQRQVSGTPSYDHTGDVRIMLKQDLGPVQLIVDHSTVLLNGDSLALGLVDSTVDQTVTNDASRRWDWTWEIEDGDRHQSFHRLDRLAFKWQSSQWGVTVGREAVSWGNGIVFQPMDLFSPFSPTVVDRDYKAGDDLVLIDRLLGNGQDLQLLHIARRDIDGDATSDVSSTALKWHGYVGSVEYDVVAAQHYDVDVFAAATRFPVGQALVRVDVVASEDLAGDQVFSGVVNADLTFVLADRNAYAFAEYFHNGWGVSELPDDITLLPLDLQIRLARGEIFNLMKNYVALGFNYEWHPLVSHSATLITNLHDNSSLFQTGVSYTPSDNQSLQFGLIEPFGGTGDEFGELPILGGLFTTGGASRVYLRWVYYLGL